MDRSTGEQKSYIYIVFYCCVVIPLVMHAKYSKCAFVQRIIATTPLMCYPFTVVYVGRHWSLQVSPSVRHQRTLQDHGYGPVYHAMCLFIHLAFTRYLLILAIPTEDRLRLSRPGCLVLCQLRRLPRWFAHPKTLTYPSKAKQSKPKMCNGHVPLNPACANKK